MHCVLYLPKASAQLLPPYLNPDPFRFLICYTDTFSHLPTINVTFSFSHCSLPVGRTSGQNLRALPVDPAGDTCSKTSTQQGKLRPAPPGAKATGTLTGEFQVSSRQLLEDVEGDAAARGLRPNRGRSAWSTRSIS